MYVMSVCMYVCMFVCMYVCMYGSSVCMDVSMRVGNKTTSRWLISMVLGHRSISNISRTLVNSFSFVGSSSRGSQTNPRKKTQATSKLPVILGTVGPR